MEIEIECPNCGADVYTEEEVEPTSVFFICCTFCSATILVRSGPGGLTILRYMDYSD